MTRQTTLIMGVLNLTPDSFSDGGRFVELEHAMAHARAMVAQGARIIDVGGESTRPGAARVDSSEEQRRVLPVIEQLVAEGITVSIDTVNAETARLAARAGAAFINDVSGGTADPLMRRVAADSGAHYIVMHWRGIPDPADARSHYDNVVEEVRSELARLAEAAIAAGVPGERLILDPGLGFDKSTAQGWQLLAGLPRLRSLGHPVLLGVSRKRMLGETLAARGLGNEMPMRDVATAAVSALAAQAGAWGVRVHEVASTAAALATAAAWGAAGGADDEPPRGRSTRDRITLTGLEVFAHHGVLEFERRDGQRFVIDADLTVDLRAAANGDDLARTVNYAALAAALQQGAEREPVDLIETLAERLARIALDFAGVEEARITVHKPEAPIEARFADVSVTVVRSRGDR